MPTQIVMQNELFMHTEWEDHKYISIGLHDSHGFNFIDVENVIEITQMDKEDNEAFEEDVRNFDFKENNSDASILLTLEAAKLLVDNLTILIKVAEERQNKPGQD